MHYKIWLRPVLFMQTFVFICACSPLPHRHDVAIFKDSVDASVDAFEILRLDAERKLMKDNEKRLARRGVKVEPVGDCTAVITDKLQKDASCMAQWSIYRAKQASKRSDIVEPGCKEPAFDVHTKRFIFYDIEKVYRTEADACRLGVRRGNSVSPDALARTGVLQNTAILSRQLKSYVDALSKLTEVSDFDALNSAVGDAKLALDGLAVRVEEMSGKQLAMQQAMDPITDLLGSSLKLLLENRRYNALKKITQQADPVIAQSAGILSRNSMVLMIPRLRELGDQYLASTEVFNEELKNSEWLIALAHARLHQASYLTLYRGHPASAFQSMADAHHALVEALDDPESQFMSMKASIKEFSATAKAARESLVKVNGDK